MSNLHPPNIFLNVPNCIGYSRVALLGFSFYSMLYDYKISMALYLLSQFLDVFDGLAARLLNQSTVFGSMLDQVTDRMSSMCLLMTLAHLYPNYFTLFQLITVIDISSHWLHFFSSKLQGKVSHKSSDPTTNVFIRLYYEHKSMLFLVCAMYEIFFCSLVVYYYTTNLYILLLIYICAPVVVLKILINILQFIDASKVIGRLDEENLIHSY